jgi:twitching motility protein PilT
MEYKSEAESLVESVISEGASDLHVTAGMNPIIRVSGNLIPLLKRPKYSAEDTMGLLTALLTSEKKKQFLDTQEVDFSYAYKDKARFRGNAFFQQGTVSIALRLIPKDIRTFEELNLPPILETFSQLQQGFFLVVGPVGQGKSTTLASMIERINTTRTEHIITIEDPIEYTFVSKNSVINQREVEIDTKSFHAALRAPLTDTFFIYASGAIGAGALLLDRIDDPGTAATTTNSVASSLAATTHVAWTPGTYHDLRALSIRHTQASVTLYVCIREMLST